MSRHPSTTRLPALGLTLLLALPAFAGQPEPGVDSLRLYALDCGTLSLDAAAMDMFEDTGEYADTPGRMSVPCFLVRHPAGDLVWDTGLGDHLVGQGEVTVSDGIRAQVRVSLQAQLLELGLAPDDIDFVAFSHHHFDHTSNTPLFAGSTFLLNRKETDWSLGSPTPFGVDADSLRPASGTGTRFIDLDHDVFGDGSVRILMAPGHTPGHQVLKLNLENAGTVILSGDLYHTRANFRHSRVPRFNDSRAETLASFDRMARLIDRYDARMVIQHDPEDFAGLPRFPAYLD